MSTPQAATSLARALCEQLAPQGTLTGAGRAGTALRPAWCGALLGTGSSGTAQSPEGICRAERPLTAALLQLGWSSLLSPSAG